MGQRSKVLSLPRDVRAQLDAALIARGFSGYRELAEWLSGQGHPIGKSALNDYGRGIERRLDQIRLSTEQAEALVAAAPDDQNALADFGTEYPYPPAPAMEMITSTIEILFHPFYGEEMLGELVRDDPEMLDLALAALFRYNPDP